LTPSIYQRDAGAAPDAAFEPGRLHHLVAGNRGRLLDPRRTPVSVAEIRVEVGCFVVRIEAFEDEGARWEVPFEEVAHYQFARGGERAAAAEVERYGEAIERLDRPLTIRCEGDARAETLARIEEAQGAAAAWLRGNSRFFEEGEGLPDPDRREGSPLLSRDLRRFLEPRGLWEMDEALATQYVSNPYSGERIKGHRIVIAQLGLVDYEGKAVRDPSLFDGPWARDRRAEHVVARLGFNRALFSMLGLAQIVLYRGISTEGPLEEADNRTFVSATFSREVARSHFDSGSDGATCVLLRQAVPVERVFMTYLETEPMNRRFREAEAVLLFDPDNRAF
jgi:hypothetical protein